MAMSVLQLVTSEEPATLEETRNLIAILEMWFHHCKLFSHRPLLPSQEIAMHACRPLYVPLSQLRRLFLNGLDTLPSTTQLLLP